MHQKWSHNLVYLVVAILTLSTLGFSSDRPRQDNPIRLGTSDNQVYLPLVNNRNGTDLIDIFGVNSISAQTLDEGGAKLATIGARYVRLGIEWRELAPTPDITPNDYPWSSFDSAISQVAARGSSLIVTLGGNPCWAASFNRGPIDRVDLSKWTEYVSAVVSHYSAPPYYVKYWEIYNEPDAVSFDRDPSSLDCKGEQRAEAFGDHPDDYVQTLKAAHEAIKSINPNAVVLLGGLASDLFYEEDPQNGKFVKRFLDDILATGAAPYFDVMNFHYYPTLASEWGGNEQTALKKKADYLSGILAKYQVVKPMVCTEIGVSSAVRSGETVDTAEDRQAREVIKLFARASAANLRIAIWYNMVDYTDSDPATAEFREQGLLRAETYDLKPAGIAYRTLSTALNGFMYKRALAPNEMGIPNVEGYVYLGADGSQQIIILWTTDGASRAYTPLSGRTVTAFDKTNNPVPREKGKYLISGDPIFIQMNVP